MWLQPLWQLERNAAAKRDGAAQKYGLSKEEEPTRMRQIMSGVNMSLLGHPFADTIPVQEEELSQRRQIMLGVDMSFLRSPALLAPAGTKQTTAAGSWEEARPGALELKTGPDNTIEVPSDEEGKCGIPGLPDNYTSGDSYLEESVGSCLKRRRGNKENLEEIDLGKKRRATKKAKLKQAQEAMPQERE